MEAEQVDGPGWRREVDALLAAWARPPDPSPLPESAAEWLRREGGQPVVVEGLHDVPAHAEAVAVSTGLLWDEDPVALLDAVADALAGEGLLFVAVPWGSPHDGGRRALHPASLLGLLRNRFSVEELSARDGLIAARARVANDQTAREDAAIAALQAVQPEMEEVLNLWSRSRSEVGALRHADALSLEGMAELHDAEHTTRRQRNEARMRLREERAGWARERKQLADRLQQAEGEAEEAQAHAKELGDRVAQMEGSRVWRIGRLLADTRDHLRRWASLPARLLSLMRGRQ